MLYDNSLEKEDVKLSYRNQIEVSLIASRLNMTPEGVVNTLLDILTATNTQPVKDFKKISEKREKELEKYIEKMTLKEAEPYLKIRAKYSFMSSFFDRTDLLEILNRKEEVDEEDDDDIP